MNRNNPFAGLRLPANATTAEIKSAGQLALAKLRLGDAGNVAAIRAVESAVEQLRDPVIRFKMGLEWPSLGPAAAKFLATDDAFGDLVSNWAMDRTQAIEKLIAGESLAGQQHIQAIFQLLRARECFACALKPDYSVQGSPARHLAAAGDLFPKAMRLWVAATTSPEFWMAQRLRAKEINDPRVGAELCSTCQRESLQIAAQSFAALASEAMLARNVPVCVAIINGIQSCGGAQSDIDRTLEAAYEAISGRATTALGALQAKVTATKSNAGAVFQSLLNEYVREVHPDMKTILIVGDLPGTAEERCRDAAASFLRNLAVESANQADAYVVSEECLRLAQEVVDSTQIRRMIASDCLLLQNIAKSSEEAKKLNTLRAALKAELESMQFQKALATIDLLIEADRSHATELQSLRAQVRRHVNSQNLTEAAAALRAESKQGCLSVLVVATAVIAGAGGAIGGAAFGWDVLRWLV